MKKLRFVISFCSFFVIFMLYCSLTGLIAQDSPSANTQNQFINYSLTPSLLYLNLFITSAAQTPYNPEIIPVATIITTTRPSSRD